MKHRSNALYIVLAVVAFGGINGLNGNNIGNRLSTAELEKIPMKIDKGDFV